LKKAERHARWQGAEKLESYKNQLKDARSEQSVGKDTQKPLDEFITRENSDRVSGFIEIAGALAKSGQMETVTLLLSKVSQVFDTMTNDTLRVELLSRFIVVLAQIGSFDEALEIAQEIRDLERQSQILLEVFEIACTTQNSRTSDILEAITQPRDKVNALIKLGAANYEREQHEEAKLMLSHATELAGGLYPEALQAAAFSQIALVLHKAGSLEEAKAKFTQAYALAQKSLTATWRTWALCKFAVHVAQAGYSDWSDNALKTADVMVSKSFEVPVLESPVSALSHFAEALATLGKFDEATKVASEISDYYEQDWVWDFISLCLANQARFPEAFDVIRNMKTGDYYGKSIINLAMLIAKSGKYKYALDIFGNQSIDKLIICLASLRDMLESAEHGMFIQTLRENTRIAGWLDPEWKEINESLVE
jgi:tetratricopeptide (TPR) repeat protein